MRIPGRKIWRAFRELDEFSDEQCRRFVKRAWGGWVQRVLALVLVFGTFLGTLVGVGYLMGWVYGSFDLDNRKRFSDSQITAMMAIGVVCVATTAPLMALLVRDFFLRSLIWRVLNIGGVCSECSYPLYGLPLSESMMCACPECGAQTEVDAALVELVRVEGGQTVARRRQSNAANQAHFWTSRKLRFTGRMLLVAFLLVFALPVAVLLINEVIVQVEAVRANRWMAHAADFAKALGTAPALTKIGDPRRFAGAAAVDSEVEKMLASYRQREGEAQPENFGGSDPISGWVFVSRVDRPEAEVSESWRLKHDEEKQRVERRRKIIAGLERQGLSERLIDAAQVKPAPFSIIASDDSEQLEFEIAWSSGVASAVGIERFRLAAEDGDLAKFEESLRAAVALVHAEVTVPAFNQHWQAAAREMFLWRAVRDAVQIRPEWAKSALKIVNVSSTRPDYVRMFEIERLNHRNWILSTIADPAVVRFNRYTPELGRRLGSLVAGRVGWVGENVAMNDRVFDDFRAQLGAQPWNRPSLPAVTSDLLLVQYNSGMAMWYLPMVDWWSVNREGIRVWLAIEAFRAANGKLPSELEELGLPPDVLVDPLSGKPWGYVAAPDPETIRKLRPIGGFLLYSLSLDRVDDFAAAGDASVFVTDVLMGMPASLSGQDVMINAGLR